MKLETDLLQQGYIENVIGLILFYRIRNEYNLQEMYNNRN